MKRIAQQRRRLAAIAAFAVAWSGPAVADSRQRASPKTRAINKQAAELYRKSADAGDPRSLTNLGWLHMKGYGVDHNPEAAVALYRKAAKKGFAVAEYNRGSPNRRGSGVAKKRTDGDQMFRRAAEQDHMRAQYNLGQHYLRGVGTEKDVVESVKWFPTRGGQGIWTRAIPPGPRIPQGPRH